MSCPQHCCASLAIPLTGCDLYDLVSHLKVPARCFAQAVALPRAGPLRFRLGPSGPWWRLLLARAQDPPGPCLFLADLEGGYRRCGVYEHRPARCRTYPFVEHDHEEPMLLPGRLCPAHSFEEPEPAQGFDWRQSAAWVRGRARLEEMAVASWNRRVSRLDPGAQLAWEHFLAFQLGLRGELAAAGRTGDPEAAGPLLDEMEQGDASAA